MTPEGKVKKMIKEQLNQYGVYSYMPVSNGMGAPALDFICCYRGLFFSIEAKAPGKHMTPRQIRTAHAIADAGGQAFEVYDAVTMGDVIAWLAARALEGEHSEHASSS